MQTESLHSAKQELKRIDHSVFVSLKYTRTVDVLQAIIDRLIAAMDFGMEALLHHAKENHNLPEIPVLPVVRATTVKSLYSDPVVLNHLNFYLLLRKIRKAEFTRTQEYRRHVTMTALVENQQILVTIDTIEEYFTKVKDFIVFVENTISGKVQGQEED